MYIKKKIILQNFTPKFRNQEYKNIPKMCGPSVTMSSVDGLVQANSEYREPCLTYAGILQINFSPIITIFQNPPLQV